VQIQGGWVEVDIDRKGAALASARHSGRDLSMFAGCDEFAALWWSRVLKLEPLSHEIRGREGAQSDVICTGVHYHSCAPLANSPRLHFQ